MRNFPEFRVVEQKIAKDTDPSEGLEEALCWVAQAIEYVEKLTSGTSDEEEEQEEAEETEEVAENREFVYSFLEKSLPSLVKQVLKRKITSVDARLLATEFLREVLRLVVRWISMDVLPVIKLLPEIFDEDAKFHQQRRLSGEYTNYPGSASHEDESSLDDEADQEDGSSGRFTATPSYYQVPATLLMLVNHFGELGGFDAVVERVSCDSDPIELKHALWYLKTADTVHKLLKPDFRVKWVLQLKDATVSLVLNYKPEQLKATSKAALARAADMLKNLLSQVLSKEEACEEVEKFQLDVAYMCLYSNTLEKRLQGLLAINQMIQRAARKGSAPYSHSGYYTHSRTSYVEPTVWLSSDYMVEWVREKNIIEDLFGAKMHHELLKRASEIFKLYTQKGEFTTDHLDTLWSSASGKQEATVGAIYVIIRDLLPHFSTELFLHFFGLLEKHPNKDFDVDLVLLVQKTAECTIQQNCDASIKEVPLEILWKLTQDGSGVSEDVYQQALPALFNTFVSFNRALSEQKMPYIMRCIENIRSDTSVPQSVGFLKKLLGLFPTNKSLRMSETESMDKVIDDLDSAEGLVDLIVSNLVLYQESAATAAEASELSGTDLDDARLLPGFLSHKMQVSCRLSILIFLLRHCGEESPLTDEHVDKAWACLIENAVSPTDADLAFAWMKNCCENYLIAPEVQMHIFDRLTAADFSTLTGAGFDCFERYFRFKNGQEELLAESETLHRFMVLNPELIGLESLWKIALAAKDEKIADKAISYLCTLLNRLAPDVKEQSATLRQGYLTHVMAELAEASASQDSAGSAASEFRVLRCLALLEKLVSDYDTKSSSKRSYGIAQYLYVRFEDGGVSSTVNVPTYPGDRLEDVRTKLEAKFASRLTEDTTINLVVRGRAVPETEYGKTLVELRIEQHTLVSAVVGDRESPKRAGASKGGFQLKSAEDEDEESPRYFLSHDASCFNQLFDLLDFSPVVGVRVWQLISQLPVNPEQHEAARTVDNSTEWDQLLHTDSTFKLLYMLRIIEGLSSAKHTTRAQEEEQAEWIATFASAGGFRRLYDILTHQDELVTGEQRKTCLEALTKLINIFMLDQSGKDSKLTGDFDWIDFPQLVHVLITVIWDCAKDTVKSGSAIDGELVSHTSTLLVAVMFAKPELLETLYSYPDLRQFIQCALLETSEDLIRKQITNGLVRLCLDARLQAVSPAPIAVFVPLLLEFLPNVPAASQFCPSYFQILDLLVRTALRQKAKGSGPEVDLDVSALGDSLAALIKDHPMVELANSECEDLALVGLMKLLSGVVAADRGVQSRVGGQDQLGLVRYVFCDCLFDLPDSQNHGPDAPPMCKQPKSRAAAFNLLRALVADNEVNFLELMHLMEMYHLQSGSVTQEWNYSPTAEGCSPVGYVGLMNLGCICYMNSLLQQLFMMPKFRRSILALPDPGDSEEKPRAEVVTYQIQRMFSYLQESQKQCYNPLDLCNSIKDYDGNPTDICVQMDVDEFFNVLCEKVEEDLKGTKFEKLLQNIWGGKLCSQLICQECKYVSERDEPYFTVSLDIKNRANVKEALEQYVQGEMLEGDNAYFCEKCDRKVSALMRRCIKTLPSTLIMHLKRFEFNFDTMRKLKLNDYLEFPREVSMEPYTKEGLAAQERAEAEKEGKEVPAEVEMHEPEYYRYKLVGILVHRGVAESGHYYSFIQKRGNGEEAEWLEFNDEVVQPFNMDDLERECFGGQEELNVSETASRYSKVVTRTRNAYMLIYERADSAPEEYENLAEEGQEMAVSKKTAETFSVGLPKDMYKQAWEENVQFLRDMKVFDESYFQFNLDLLTSYTGFTPCLEYGMQPKENFAVIAQALQFLLQVLVHSKEKEFVAKHVAELKKRMAEHVPACMWFLSELALGDVLEDLLLECRSKDTRTLLGDLIVFAIGIVFPYEEEAFDEVAVEEEPEPERYRFDDEDAAATRAVTLRVMEKLFSLFYRVSYYWRTFSQFFHVFLEFARQGPVQRDYLFRKQIVTLLHDLIMHGSPFKLRKAPKMGDKVSGPRFANAIATIAELLRGSLVQRDPHEDMTQYEIHDHCPYRACDSVDIVPFPRDQLELLFGGKWDFLKHVTDDMSNLTPICKILRFWSWESEEATIDVVEFLRMGANDVEYDHLQPWFTLIQMYLERTDDRLIEQRVFALIDGLLVILQKFRTYPKFTRAFITYLFDMYEDVPDVRACLDSQEDRWAWVEQWMSQRGFSCRTFQNSKWNSVNYYNNQQRGYGYSSRGHL